MKRTMLLAACALLAIPAMAKRVGPAPVPSVYWGGFEYRVEHFPAGPEPRAGGVLEIRDARTGALVESVEVYRNDYDPDLERDAQDVFIARLELQRLRGRLKITDERERVYYYDLKAKTVRRG